MSNLLRSNITVAGGTAVSRVTGLIRTFVISAVLGRSLVSDAYLVANETPNIIYDLLLGGVLSATLVPLFTTYLGNDDTDRATRVEQRRAINAIVTTAVALLTILTIIAVIAAPLIFRLYALDAPAGVDLSAYRQAGTALARIFLVQIFFYGVAGVANAYLHSQKHFFAAAWSPALANLITIVALLTLPGAGTRIWEIDEILDNDRLRYTLGFGATLGIVTMAATLVPATFKAGLRFRPVFDFGHPAVKKLLALSGWTVGFVLANQVALTVVRNLALAELGSGGQSAYIYAFTFFVLPHGLLAVSVATTFQPDLARAVANRDHQRLVDRVTLGVRSIAALTFPSSAVIVVLSEPIIGLMQRNNFDAAAVVATSRALAGLGLGLVGFSIYLFLLRGFYAHQDTRTPFVLNVGENLLNIILALLFVRWWGLLGLGLAYAVAYLLSAWWALVVLRNKTHLPLAPIWNSIWRLALASTLMGQAMWFVTHSVTATGGWLGVAQLVIGGGVGAVVFVAALVALQSPELDAFVRLAARLRQPTGSTTVPRPPRATG